MIIFYTFTFSAVILFSNGRDDLAVDTPSINYCDEVALDNKIFMASSPCALMGFNYIQCCCDYSSNLQTLKLDKVVSEGYRVLKEVKRHKNKAEMEWDLVRLEERFVCYPI